MGEMIDDHFKDSKGCDYHFYVAEEEGQVAGYVCYGPDTMTQGTWDVYWLAVNPVLAGQGTRAPQASRGLRRPPRRAVELPEYCQLLFIG